MGEEGEGHQSPGINRPRTDGGSVNAVRICMIRCARILPAILQTEAIATLKPLFCLPLHAHVEIITPSR